MAVQCGKGSHAEYGEQLLSSCPECGAGLGHPG